MKDTRAATTRIQSHQVLVCYLCGSQGKLIHEGVRDLLFGAPGNWSFRVCPNSECGLMWLDPTPLDQEISKAYAQYYTHGEAVVRRGRIVDALRKRVSSVLLWASPLRRERKRLSLMYLDNRKPGKLLDVGCGNGVRLAQLRTLGWDVHGQDVDAVAVGYARDNLGIEAHLAPLEDIGFAGESFDCVTLNHVIEHVPDPIRLITECRRILRKNGVLVVVTPNASSFAHKHFGRFWRGLEPPRHFHLFSPKTLSTVAARSGFLDYKSWTTVAHAKLFGYGSLLIKGGGLSSGFPSRLLRRSYIMGHVCRSMVEHARDANSGEECVLWAIK